MALTDLLTVALVLAGAFFFVSGTLGLLRFPDVYTRLHALTKADNLGLGLVLAGLALQAPSVAAVMKLLLVWLLIMLAGAGSAHLVARAARQRGTEIWKK